MRTAIVLSLYSALVLAVILYEIIVVVRRRRRERHREATSRLLLLVRDLADMAYLYGNDPEKFYLKFLEEFNIISLRRRGIIDPDVLLKSSAYIFLYDNMKRSDAELWALRKAGFSNRGLVIIYGFKNLNSIYVKFNRLSKRVRL